MAGEQVEEQNDRDRDAFKALLLRLHAPVKPQHDYYDCCLPDCQRCAGLQRRLLRRYPRRARVEAGRLRA